MLEKAIWNVARVTFDKHLAFCNRPAPLFPKLSFHRVKAQR